MHARARRFERMRDERAFRARSARARGGLRLRTSATPRDDYDPETLFSPAVQRDLPVHIGEMYGLEKDRRRSPRAGRCGTGARTDVHR